MPVKFSILALQRSSTDSQKPMTYLSGMAFIMMKDVVRMMIVWLIKMKLGIEAKKIKEVLTKMKMVNVTVHMEMAMELASVNISPMAPPNSGPRDLQAR